MKTVRTVKVDGCQLINHIFREKVLFLEEEAPPVSLYKAGTLLHTVWAIWWSCLMDLSPFSPWWMETTHVTLKLRFWNNSKYSSSHTLSNTDEHTEFLRKDTEEWKTKT